MTLDLTGWSDEAILVELGARLRRVRLNANVTQQELADRAGVSLGAVRGAEAGSGTSLTTFIRVLRALGLVDGIGAIVPEPEISPLDLLQMKGASRSRASGSGTPKRDG